MIIVLCFLTSCFTASKEVKVNEHELLERVVLNLDTLKSLIIRDTIVFSSDTTNFPSIFFRWKKEGFRLEGDDWNHLSQQLSINIKEKRKNELEHQFLNKLVIKMDFPLRKMPKYCVTRINYFSPIYDVEQNKGVFYFELNNMKSQKCWYINYEGFLAKFVLDESSNVKIVDIVSRWKSS